MGDSTPILVEVIGEATFIVLFGVKCSIPFPTIGHQREEVQIAYLSNFNIDVSILLRLCNKNLEICLLIYTRVIYLCSQFELFCHLHKTNVTLEIGSNYI